MQLIVVEVLVKVACQSTTVLISVEVLNHHHESYCCRSTCESGFSVHNSHRLKTQNKLHLHATYSGGSICKSGLSVHDRHRLKEQGYLHATYPGGSICECGLSAMTATE